MRRSLDGLVRLVRWLASSAHELDEAATCPVCGRTVRVMYNHMPATPASNMRIPRPVGELVGACTAQHGIEHTAAEVAAARAEKPWRQGPGLMV